MQVEQRREPQQQRIQQVESPPAAKTDAPAQPSDPAAVEAPVTATPRRGRRPFLILGIIAAVVLIGIGLYLKITAGRETTDDAQVMADLVPVSARVTGQLAHVAISENQLVKKGDIIASIDDRDFAAKLAQAKAELESAEAQAAEADAQVSIVTATSKGGLSSAKAAYSGSSVGVASADAQVAAAQAELVRAQADLRKLESDLNRAKELHQANAIPQERLDNAQAAYDVGRATIARAQANLTAAQEAKRAAKARVSEAAGRVAQSTPIEAQVAAAQAHADLAHARVESAKSQVALAELQLSYTKIVAPADGIASKLSLHEGAMITAGQPIIELVPTATYVLANFKETQIGNMRVGQRATISIDAFPHREFEGKVESLSGGTGASFSLLPADNASGNFVKVVQRVPVRIAWTNVPKDVALRAGLSVEATVYTE